MRAYIGLGSNLDKPQQQILTAIDDLNGISQTKLVTASSLYCSPPMGPQDQPDYTNAVACIETSLTPQQLLSALQSIEQQHGRVRERRWGERSLDLDILLFADKVINDENLTVPHVGLAQRAFVVYPLAEIAPDIDIPNVGSLRDIQSRCPLDGLEKLER